MKDSDKYKFLCETKSIFEKYGTSSMEAFVLIDDTLDVFWHMEEKPSRIKNPEMIGFFKEYNQLYVGDELKKKFYDKAIELLTIQTKQYEDSAKKESENDKRVLKVRCCYYDNGKLFYVPGRSTNCTYCMKDLYGMRYETVLEDCKKTVNRWRSEDTSKWHVLDENDRIIY